MYLASRFETSYVMYMKIDIISDTVCPWCLIGKRKLEEALRQRPDLDVEISWHPFQLHPDMPLEGEDRREFTAKKFGSAERAKELYQKILINYPGSLHVVDARARFRRLRGDQLN